MVDNLTIGICNFNTTDLTNQTLKTIEANLPECKHQYIILDNSDESKFELSTENQDLNLKILDNTVGRYINFSKVVQMFCNTQIHHSHNGSLKHCYSIQWLLDICQTKMFLLADSDIIVNKKIDFLDEDYATIAHIQYEGQPNEKTGKSFGKPYQAKTRFLPYLQFFNLELLQKYHVKYFNPMKMHGGLAGNVYDTGAAFYEEVTSKNLPFKTFDYHDYLFHYAAMSWKKYDVEHRYTNP